MQAWKDNLRFRDNTFFEDIIAELRLPHFSCIKIFIVYFEIKSAKKVKK